MSNSRKDLNIGYGKMNVNVVNVVAIGLHVSGPIRTHILHYSITIIIVKPFVTPSSHAISYGGQTGTVVNCVIMNLRDHLRVTVKKDRTGLTEKFT